MANLFKNHSQNEHALSIAAYFPGGRLFGAARTLGTKLFSFLRGLASEFQRVEQFLSDLPSELDPRTTVNLIEEWERNVGIPDSCIPIASTIEQRRANVVLKLTALGAQTEQDFVELATLLGFEITIVRPSEEFVPPYDVPFIPEDGTAVRFTWIIRGANIVKDVPPYAVPFIPEEGSAENILQCLFNKLKPANTLLLFENI